MYACAILNPKLDFKVAYRNTYERSLNGYTGIEMIEMFIDAAGGKLSLIPDNVYFSGEWYDYITHFTNYK
jgi:hypothetical protein